MMHGSEYVCVVWSVIRIWNLKCFGFQLFSEHFSSHLQRDKYVLSMRAMRQFCEIYVLSKHVHIRTVRTYRVLSVPISSTAFITTNFVLCRSKLCLEDFQTFLKSEQKVSFCIYWCCYSYLVQALLASQRLPLQNRFYSQLLYSLGTLCWRRWQGQAAYDVIHR